MNAITKTDLILSNSNGELDFCPQSADFTFSTSLQDKIHEALDFLQTFGAGSVEFRIGEHLDFTDKTYHSSEVAEYEKELGTRYYCRVSKAGVVILGYHDYDDDRIETDLILFPL